MRVYNFNPGPSTLPTEVLEKVQAELLDYQGKGLSVMEMSHRSPEFSDILARAKQNLRDVMKINDNYEILFLQGGASLQFFMLPMNFLSPETKADYIDTGSWASKAVKEARPFGSINVIFSGKNENYSRIPSWNNLPFSDDALYCHITSNNTIYGTQYKDYGNPGGPKLVADMSSDIMTRSFDIEKFSMIYAGAQKNLGPSGVTLVIIRKDFAAKAKSDIPTLLQYKTHIEKDSLYNTPPTFAIYLVMCITEWAVKKGGIDALEKECRVKAGMVYETVDGTDFYIPTASKDSRSLTNITFRLKNEALEKIFIEEAKKEKLIGLKGHRSVGGIRVSNYSAMSLKGIQTLVDFMKDFEKRNT
ncbi:MAG: 3-phosphoserine/phosphohydroxythreonine transaminase [Candidatus Aureabacteria bacterium]|nr:3-phosphoserine/phosphohydroxythreonine transaminase [Candidatus Auribacterota bacterium]